MSLTKLLLTYNSADNFYLVSATGKLRKVVKGTLWCPARTLKILDKYFNLADSDVPPKRIWLTLHERFGKNRLKIRFVLAYMEWSWPMIIATETNEIMADVGALDPLVKSLAPLEYWLGVEYEQ